MKELADSAPAGVDSPAHPLPLADKQGRHITYLRLSLTDKCNFRCSYCSPSSYDGNASLLTRAEIHRLVRLLARLGMRRVRLTGGEPTVRKDIVEIAADVASTPGIAEVAITTNGSRLGELAGPLARAGVTHVNFSLDTLRAERIERVSGKHARLDEVIAGFEAAARAGFRELKVNTVVLGGVNSDELGDLVRFAWARGATPRFIELMPFGGGAPVPTAEVKRLLAGQGVTLEPDATRGWGPAYYMRGTERPSFARARAKAEPEHPRTGLVGFISPMTENFCDACNRVRVGPNGALRACLGGTGEVPLRDLLRSGAADDAIEARVRDALANKGDRHHMEAPEARLVLLPMMGIGG